MCGRTGVDGHPVEQNKDVAICPLCDLELDWCVHGLQATQKERASSAMLLISPRGMAHFAGCPHKGDDDDLTLWAKLEAPVAWSRLGSGEKIPATGGQPPELWPRRGAAIASSMVRGRDQEHAHRRVGAVAGASGAHGHGTLRGQGRLQ